MAKKSKQTSYWPHMILGFLIVGITLSYWTVKSASSVPVQETDDYMMKYQQADLYINDILTKKKRFDSNYTIAIEGVKKGKLKLEHVKRNNVEEVVLLQKGANTFTYRVVDKSGKPVEGVKVSFLLTRPHTDEDDLSVESVPAKNGAYVVADVNISKPGRYTLRLKAVVDEETVGYSDLPAYLNP